MLTSRSSLFMKPNLSQSLNVLWTCVLRCPSGFTFKHGQLLGICQAAERPSLQGICYKCTSDFVIHSKHTDTQKSPKCAYCLTFTQSPISHSHTHTHRCNTLRFKVCPMHELSKSLLQLQQTKLFSLKSPFSSSESFLLVDPQPAVVCPSLSNCLSAA